MNRLPIQIGFALIAFFAGLQFNQLVLGLAEQAINYEDVVIDVSVTSTLDPVAEEEETLVGWNPIVISMADKRDVYVGKTFVGTPDDTGQLEEEVAITIANQELRMWNAQSRELSQRIQLPSDDRMIYIKVFIGSSRADVVRLVEAARRIGFQHIALLVDGPKQNAGCDTPTRYGKWF